MLDIHNYTDLVNGNASSTEKKTTNIKVVIAPTPAALER